MPDSTTQRPAYQLLVTTGIAFDAVAHLATTCHDLSVDTVTREAFLTALDDTGLTSGDVRARILLAAAANQPARAVGTLASMLGMSARWVDVAGTGALIRTDQLVRSAGKVPDSHRPEDRDPVVVVAAADAPADVLARVAATDIPVVRLDADDPVGTISPADAVRIRYSRDVVLFVGPAVEPAVAAAATIGGLRRRGRLWRLPWLAAADVITDAVDVLVGHHSQVAAATAAGTDPTPLPADLGLGVISLEHIRLDGAQQRRSRRGYTVAVVDPADLPARLARAAAVDADPDVVLDRLGARRNPDAGVWHCPRPERHRNGDAKPSTKVADGKVRCFGTRCDAEPVGVIRLIADTLDITGDEAVDLLTGHSRNGAKLVAARRAASPHLRD